MIIIILRKRLVKKILKILITGQHPYSPSASWQQVVPDGHSEPPPGHASLTFRTILFLIDFDW